MSANGWAAETLSEAVRSAVSLRPSGRDEQQVLARSASRTATTWSCTCADSTTGASS